VGCGRRETENWGGKAGGCEKNIRALIGEKKRVLGKGRRYFAEKMLTIRRLHGK